MIYLYCESLQGFLCSAFCLTSCIVLDFWAITVFYALVRLVDYIFSLHFFFKFNLSYKLLKVRLFRTSKKKSDFHLLRNTTHKACRKMNFLQLVAKISSATLNMKKTKPLKKRQKINLNADFSTSLCSDEEKLHGLYFPPSSVVVYTGGKLIKIAHHVWGLQKEYFDLFHLISKDDANTKSLWNFYSHLTLGVLQKWSTQQSI